MLAFRHQLNLTVLLIVGLTVLGLLGLSHYQLNRQVSDMVGKTLQEHIALLSQHNDNLRRSLLYDAGRVAELAVKARWFIFDAKPLPDLVNSQPFPAYQPIVAVVREDAVITRATVNQQTHPLLLELPKWPYFQTALQDNRSRSGWFRVGQELYVIVTQPVPGEAPARGAVFIAAPLQWPQLEVLRDTGIVVFDENGKILSSQPLHWDLPQFTDEFEVLFKAAQNTQDKALQGITADDYAYVLATNPAQQLPTFMLLQPIHERINFIHTLLWPALGMLALVGGLWWYLVTFLHKQLRQILDAMMMTVEHIERENYSHRLSLPDREELNVISDAFNEMLSSLEERERIHGVMAQMTSYDVAAKLLNGTLRSDGELRRCTVLIADIPEFSALTRKLTAPVALQVLNDYLTRMSFCVEANGGLVDKYLGDTIIALFGLEKHAADAAFAAVQTAQDMLDAMTLFNLETAAPRGLSMHLQITLATGKLVTGTVGASHHASYSGFGETINYAISLRRYLPGDSSHILCDPRTHKLFWEAAQTTTQALLESRPLEQDNVTVGFLIQPRVRNSNPVLVEQVRA